MTNNLTYCSEQAVSFVVDCTDYPSSIIEQVLREQEVYEVLMGVCPSEVVEDFASDKDLAAKKRRYADLLHGNDPENVPFLSWESEAEFIVQETGLLADVVTNILREETRYKVHVGIMDAEAVGAYQEWAQGWVSSREVG